MRHIGEQILQFLTEVSPRSVSQQFQFSFVITTCECFFCVVVVASRHELVCNFQSPCEWVSWLSVSFILVYGFSKTLHLSEFGTKTKRLPHWTAVIDLRSMLNRRAAVVLAPNYYKKTKKSITVSFANQLSFEFDPAELMDARCPSQSRPVHDHGL